MRSSTSSTRSTGRFGWQGRLLKATPQGLEYLRQFTVPKSVLDEDKDGIDEVFAKVRFVDADGVSRWQVTSLFNGLY